MTRKVLTCALAVLILNLFCAPVIMGQQQSSKQEKHVHKIRKNIARLKRWAPEDPITVKLEDGTKVKGYIAEVADDYFVVTNRNGRQPVSVNYSQVRDLKTGLGGKSKIALAIGGGFLAVFAICAISHRCEQ